MRAADFLPQLREKIEAGGSDLKQIIIHNSNLKLGITIMTFGFLKKMFFADNIAELANDVFTAPIGSESFTIILGAMAFGIQIYGDFSGYTDIAIGAALILGFKLPMNFNFLMHFVNIYVAASRLRQYLPYIVSSAVSSLLGKIVKVGLNIGLL